MQAEPAIFPRVPAPVTFRQSLVENYLTVDRRTLGFTRILLGFFLLTDLLRRTPAWLDMFSNEGVLPTHVNLFRPQAWGAFSLVNAFSTAPELWAFWAFAFITFFCLLIGYRTRLAQVLSLLIVTGMNGRVLLIENGGYVVQNLLLLWTVFLPLGDRFSVDGLLKSFRHVREHSLPDLNDRDALRNARPNNAHVTVVNLIILLQLSAIYYFNFIHKTGVPWRNGTGIHYVLYVDRMVTPLIGLVRDHVPGFVIYSLTYTVLAFELTLAMFLLSPLAKAWARRIAMFQIEVLHVGFGSTFVLGPFAWSLSVLATVLLGAEDWRIVTRAFKNPAREVTVRVGEGSGFLFSVGRLLRRLDGLEQVRFDAAPAQRFLVRSADGRQHEGADALACIIEALPMGPWVSWMPRMARPLWNALFAERGIARVDAWLGWPSCAAAHDAPRESPILRRMGTLRKIGIELASLVMFTGAVNQALVELWCVKNRVKVPQPEVTRVLAQKMRFLQGWFMFSPNPVMDDGTIIVDAVTVDGRHIDPFTLKVPDFDIGSVKSYGYTQIWSDYFNRMHLPQNAAYRDAMRDYIFRLPQRTGRPEDAIVSGEVFWVKDMNPRFGTHVSTGHQKESLFTFKNPNAVPQQVPKG